LLGVTRKTEYTERCFFRDFSPAIGILETIVKNRKLLSIINNKKKMKGESCQKVLIGFYENKYSLGLKKGKCWSI